VDRGFRVEHVRMEIKIRPRNIDRGTYQNIKARGKYRDLPLNSVSCEVKCIQPEQPRSILSGNFIYFPF
jgi:hypothetical protein